MAYKVLEPEVSGKTGYKVIEPEITTEVESTYGEDKPSLVENLLPATMQTWESADGLPAKIAAGAASGMTLLGDVLGIPARGLATLRGEKMVDPSAAFLRPEMEKLKDLLPESREPKPAPEGYRREIPNIPLQNIGRGAIELGGQIISDPLTWLGSLAKQGTKLAKKTAPKIFSATTGIDEDILRGASKTSKKNLVKYAGKEGQIGSDIAEMVNKFHENVPFEAAVTKVLEQAPPIDISPTIQKVADYRAKVATTLWGHPAGSSMLKSVDDLYGYLVTQRDMYGGEIPALEANKIRKWLDKQITSWGAAPSATPIDDRAYKMARSALANDITEQAGGEYAGLMNTYATAVKSAKNVQKAVGGEGLAQGRRQELFTKRAGEKMMGPESIALSDAEMMLNNPELRSRLKSIASGQPVEDFYFDEMGMGNIPGDYLTDQARMAAIARKLGMKEGSTGIPLMSKTQGIRSLILPILASGGAIPLGGWSWPAAAFSSPKVAVGIQDLIEMANKASGFAPPASTYVPAQAARAFMDEE